MLRPVLVTPPTKLPVSLDDVKSALRVDGDDRDAELERLIGSAVEHYEGWSGVLGICLVEQSWRQDFDRFDRRMCLGLRPVPSITSVTWRNSAGDESVVDAASYSLKTDAGGYSFVRFASGYSFPSDLDDDSPVSIKFVAGWQLKDGAPTTPADLQTAVILHVQKHFDEAARQNADILDRVERDLISKYRSPLV